MALHHVMLKVKDWESAKAFYTTVFAPLGMELVADWGTGGGFGRKEHVNHRVYVKQEEQPLRLHFAITAPSAEAVREFYRVALAAGGRDNGGPGPRGHLGEGAVGCFVIDLDDNNIEVVSLPTSQHAEAE